MADDPQPPEGDDLDREIAEALGDRSILEIAGREILPPTPRRTPDAAAGPQAGRFCDGVVSGVGEQDVFLEFGPRQQGVVPREQFAVAPEVGQTQRVFVEGFDDRESLFLCSIRRTVQTAAWDGLEVGSMLLGEVKAVNKGGVELQAGVLTAFLPASHVSLERVDDLEGLIGQRFEVEVIDIDRERRRLVVSRRGILGRERDEKRGAAVSALQPGAKVRGKVTRIEPFGAFVDIGGVEGLLHVSQLAYKRVEDPSKHVSVGDEIEVQVLKIEEDGRRISLSLKALQEDPWVRFTSEHPPGSVLEGTVTRIASYGAFIEVADGVEGLAHVSQLSPGPINTPKDVVRVGQKLAVRVADTDPERRRIGLSLLTDRGDRLTDDVADDETIRAVLRGGVARETQREPTLGDLLKKALEGGD